MKDIKFKDKIAQGINDLFYIWKREFQTTFRDQGVLIFFILVPLGYPLLYSFIYDNEVVREVPAVVVDDSHSSLSREYLRKVDATPDVKIVSYCADMEEAKQMLKNRRAYGIIYIPSDFSDNIAKGKQTQVSIYCDMSGLLYYKSMLLANTAVSLNMNKDIKLLTDGVIVTGFAKVGDSTDAFELSPAGKAGIEKGDVITKINGEKITSSANMSDLISGCGEYATLTYIRDGCEYTADVEIKCDSDGEKRIGLWVRDSTAGIGTMTFYQPKTLAGAGLGHAVCDVDTGEILPLGTGQIVPAVITGVKRGERDCPGELCGTLKPSDVKGRITDNCGCGLYAVLEEADIQGQLMPLAFASEVQCGQAYILSTVDSGKPEMYSVEIESVDRNSADNKNMVIKVTDERLTELTGGIVQGMSGSPIVQNGRLVGAVTHVFISDPAHGYGIFAQSMYEHLLSLSETEEQAA